MIGNTVCLFASKSKKKYLIIKTKLNSLNSKLLNNYISANFKGVSRAKSFDVGSQLHFRVFITCQLLSLTGPLMNKLSDSLILGIILQNNVHVNT